MKFYAISIGKNIGIYNSWNECKENLGDSSDTKFKIFNNIEDAQKFINSSIKLLSYNSLDSFMKENNISCFITSEFYNNMYIWCLYFPEKNIMKSDIIHRSHIIDETINNKKYIRSELYAIINTIEIYNNIKNLKPLTIYSSNDSLIKIINYYINNKWKITCEDNKDLFLQIKNLILSKNLNIYFKNVSLFLDKNDWKYIFFTIVKNHITNNIINI
tara:strand:- start:20313 stop:20960 length:648 start_codon:yes stop_codon:yes gene_type:complete